MSKRTLRLPKSYTGQERLRQKLPYGLFVCPDKSVVLFNRPGHPIWRRDAEGNITRCDPNEWIDHCGQAWFYHESQEYPVPWRSKRTLRLCLEVLRDFGVKDDPLVAERCARRNRPDFTIPPAIGPLDGPIFVGFDR